MKVCYETSIQDFEFWGGAEDHANMLTESELNQFEDFINEEYPEGIGDTQLNDLMWFDFDDIKSWLGIDDEDDEE